MPNINQIIKTTLQRFDGNLWHFHVLIKQKIADYFIEGNNRRVICVLNKTEQFQAALMPHGDGDYFININKELRTKLRLKIGDEVLLELQKDESEFGLPFPEEFEVLLQQDLEGADVFNKLTKGKQRTLLYMIGKPKSNDLRIRNAIGVLNHLKKVKGEIDFKQLTLEIKDTVI